jgi:hypothetical protein
MYDLATRKFEKSVKSHYNMVEECHKKWSSARAGVDTFHPQPKSMGKYQFDKQLSRLIYLVNRLCRLNQLIHQLDFEKLYFQKDQLSRSVGGQLNRLI